MPDSGKSLCVGPLEPGCSTAKKAVRGIGLQNTPPDIRLLSNYLVRLVRDQGVRPGSDLEQVRAGLPQQTSYNLLN